MIDSAPLYSDRDAHADVQTPDAATSADTPTAQPGMATMPADTSPVLAEAAPAPAPVSAFAALGLLPALVKALTRQDILEPTPVQAAAIPVLLEQRDLIGSAPTGTGKTAAFMLPALQRISSQSGGPGRGPRVLVLTPTRELAQQVSRATQSFSRALQRLTTVCITGGESYFLQNKALAAPYEVLVATPGRLMDQMRSGKINLSRIEVLVLDEADRMLDMGFADDVTAIAEATPASRQTVLFTATVTHDIRALASRLLRDPQWLDIQRPPATEAAIEDHVLYVDGPEHRLKLLEACLNSEDMGQAIVFTGTRRHAEELADHLGRQGLAVDALHGDMGQRERMRALNKLRRGDCKVLVATDVAARGIDVATITHVINYAPPRMAEDYIHRIGRTGRAGASGQALTFVGAEDIVTFNRIEHFLRRHVQISEFEGLEARWRPEPRKARPKGKRPQGGDSRRPRQDGHARHFDKRRDGAAQDAAPWSRRPAGPAHAPRPGNGHSHPRSSAPIDGHFRKERLEHGHEGGKPGHGEQRGYGDRPAFGEKRAYGDRPAFAEKRGHGDKPAFGDKRTYGDRPAFAEKRGHGNKPAFGEKRSYGDKPAFGEKRGYGDKPAFGEKRGYGDKPAFGEKRGFGGKPGFGEKRGFGGKPGAAGKPAYRGQGGQSEGGSRNGAPRPRTPRD